MSEFERVRIRVPLYGERVLLLRLLVWRRCCAVHLSSWLESMYCSILPIGSKVIFVHCLCVRFQPLFIINMGVVFCFCDVHYCREVTSLREKSDIPTIRNAGDEPQHCALFFFNFIMEVILTVSVK